MWVKMIGKMAERNKFQLHVSDFGFKLQQKIMEAQR